MLKFLPPFLLGIISLLSYIAFSVVSATIVLVVSLFRIFSFLRPAVDKLVRNVLEPSWMHMNRFIIWFTMKTKFEVIEKGDSGILRRDLTYLLVCNHQSWMDIAVLYKVFGGHIPILTFFMKKQLLWQLPVLGLACWCMGYPFVKRYSNSYLKKHPEKKGKDLESTKRLCKRYVNKPLTITSFIEGTRFSNEKKIKQNSKYDYLLKPKATGFAFVLSALPSLNKIIDTTIVYSPLKNSNSSESKIGLWDFLCGKIEKITVEYEIIPIDENLKGDYFDRSFRSKLQTWLNDLWQEKDKKIKTIKTKA